MVYALALSGDVDRAWVEDLYSSRAKFSAHGQALMALLLMQLKDSRAQEFVKLLEAGAHSEGPFVSWKSERQEMLDFTSDNSFETTAYALKALANLDPKSDLLPRAARWLMEHRSDGYYWESTEQTATAIYGLIDYLRISGELKPNYTLSVYLNGQKLADRNITEKDVANPLPIVQGGAALSAFGFFGRFGLLHANHFGWSETHQRIPRRRLGSRAQAARQLVLHELRERLHLPLHLAHLLAHVENDLDAGQIYPHLARQREDHFQTLEIGVRVQPRIALRARGLQETDAFVQAQRLRMKFVEFCDG